jgi:DNA-binding transcriptional LysR family regulator
MLDFRIETFLKVCQSMNYTRAAEELNITQPAVSQHMRYLEKHYRTKLFHYEGKRLKLTDAGELLRNAALTMVHDEASLKSRMDDLSGGKQEIRFGATMTVGEVVMSSILQQYMIHKPEAHLHMEVNNTQALLERLDHGDIDFALVEGFFKKTEYDFLIYSAEKYIPVCSPSYKFQKPPCQLSDLFGERLFLREPGSGTREVLERFLDSQNYGTANFNHTAEIGSLHTIKELVKAGCGITFLYEIAVRDELERNELKRIELKDCHIYHDFTFIWRRGSIYADDYRKLFDEFSYHRYSNLENLR